MASKRKTAEPSPAIAGDGDGATPDVAFLDVPSSPPDASGAVADLTDAQPASAPVDPMPPPDAKRKRGRPKGSGRKASAPEVDSVPDPAELRKREDDVADALAGTLMMISALASGEAPEFALTEKECRQLGMVWAPCLAPHMGSLGAALPWAVAAASTAQILLPKYSAYRRRVTSGDTITARPEDVVVTDEPASPGLQAEGVGT